MSMSLPKNISALSGKLIPQSVKDYAEEHPGRLTGLITVPGDIFMAASGLGYNNIGRIIGGSCGIGANASLIFFADKKKEGEIDAQDEGFWQKVTEHWKFWKYPWEVSTSLNLIQTVGMVALAGPDTASAVGDVANISGLVSDDQFRWGEAACGAIATVGFCIMYVKEDAKSHVRRAKEKIEGSSLAKTFNDFSGFTKERIQDLTQSFNILSNVKETYNNTIKSVSEYGPNSIAAKIFNIALIPYATEGVLLQDWNVVASCGVYYVANKILEKATKRTDRLEDITPEAT